MPFSLDGIGFLWYKRSPVHPKSRAKQAFQATER